MRAPRDRLAVIDPGRMTQATDPKPPIPQRLPAVVPREFRSRLCYKRFAFVT
ncbi:MAG: hypothetical protein HY286_04545 [Planctomycetes bacterium]|nr:hypothetical protein [Planctomycetota bacterium]